MNKKILENDILRFIGISLSGAKADRTSLVVLEYFENQNKIFLTHLYEKIKSEEKYSADQKLVDLIKLHRNNLKFISFDVPLSLPKCISCKLKCPGYEKCQVPEIEWMKKNWNILIKKKKKPKKIFSPYTQRCVDIHLLHTSDSEFEIQDALGSNLAPLTARGLFLERRLRPLKCIEVSPKITIWKMGQTLKINRSTLATYRNSIGGVESRKILLESMFERLGVFFYHQDQIHLIENIHTFEAFICAFVSILKYMKKTEPRPKSLPKDERWVEFPIIL